MSNLIYILSLFLKNLRHCLKKVNLTLNKFETLLLEKINTVRVLKLFLGLFEGKINIHFLL